MNKGLRKMVLFAAVMAAALISTAVVWSEGSKESQLPSCMYVFGDRFLTISTNSAIPGIRFVVKQADLDEVKGKLKGSADEKSIDSLSFAVGMQVLQPDSSGKMTEVTDFQKIKAVLQLEISFPSKDAIPAKLFIIAENKGVAQIIALNTQKDSADKNDFSVVLEQKSTGDGPIVLRVTVSKWPGGDPWISG